MKPNLRHIAVLLFLISFLLPAYRPDHDAYSGWACLKFCFGTLNGNEVRDAWRFYYFGFVFTNLLFLLLWGVSTIKEGLRSMCAWISLIPLMHVMSWLVLNLLDRERQGALLVEYGYFIWFFSFMLLSVSLFLRKNEK